MSGVGARSGSAPLLAIKGLSVDFRTRQGKVQAVRDVSLDLHPGEILGIAGESGSGKSVTLRAILGLTPPQARVHGSIVFEGRDLRAQDENEWRQLRGGRIAMIFQNPSSHLDPLRRIGWQIAAPLRRHLGLDAAAARARALDLLRDVSIARAEERIDAYPHEFSGGMKQRAMIAAAIGPAPQILLADEPTTALDVTVQARILELLRQLNRERGLAIILVSHDLGVLGEICSRLAIMRHGEIVEAGPTRDVIVTPRNPYTRRLIDSQPALRARRHREAPAAAQAAPVLEIKGLTVAFALPRGGLFLGASMVKALDDVSFAVQPGDSIGIVGESGSGKSTLARSIVLLNSPASGAILHQGRDIRQLRGAALQRYRRSVQMIFQSPYDALNPRLTAGETLAEALRRRGPDEATGPGLTVDALFDMVELPRHLAARLPAQLSGGQCQRVGIARALAMQPQILIADEITSALDVTTQAQILDLLENLWRQRGLTLLYISHDLAVVSAICQKVLVLQAGRIVESGETRKVMTAPKQPYTQQLLQSVPKLMLA